MSGMPATIANRPTLRTPDAVLPRSTFACMISSCNRSKRAILEREPKG